MSKETIDLVLRLDDIPKKEFKKILPKEISVIFLIINKFID